MACKYQYAAIPSVGVAERRSDIAPLSVDASYFKLLRQVSQEVELRAATNLPSLSRDIMFVARATYVADCQSARYPKSAGWARHMSLEVPVHEIERWSAPYNVVALNRALDTLTGDRWNVTFVRHDWTYPSGDPYLDFPPDRVCVLSDGLDSYSGLVCRLDLFHNETFEGVSTVFQNQVMKRIRRTTEYLRGSLRSEIHNTFANMQFRRRTNHGDRTYQRTRSFVMLSMAVAVALAFNRSNIEVYENGIEAFNFPFMPILQDGQASRAMHPIFLSRLSAFVSGLSGVAFRIIEPFLFETKTSLVRRAAAIGKVSEHMASTSSCMNARSKAHCNGCEGCIIRCFALTEAGIPHGMPDTGWQREGNEVYERLWRHRFELEEALSGDASFDCLMRQSGFGSRQHDELVSCAAEVTNTKVEDVPSRIKDLYRSYLNDLRRMLA